MQDSSSSSLTINVPYSVTSIYIYVHKITTFLTGSKQTVIAHLRKKIKTANFIYVYYITFFLLAVAA